MKIFIAVLAVAVGTLACPQSEQTDGASDAMSMAAAHDELLLTDGRIFTANRDAPWAEAVVIHNDLIAYVGTDAGARAFAGKSAAHHDLKGSFVMPGIVDGHTHPGLVSMFGVGAEESLIPTTSHEDIMTWLRDYSSANWFLPVIVADSWPVSLYGTAGPNKADIDAIVSIRPVVLFDDSGHSFWVNSSMLWLMGVDQDTPDPAPGLSYFMRDESGEPTGWVKEFALIPFVGEWLLAAASERERALEGYLNFLASRGVTALYDGGNLLSHDAVYELVAKLEREGRLPLRYEGTYHVLFPDQIPKAVDEIERLRIEYGGELLQFNTVKIHFDGVGEIRTAAYIEPYHDDPKNRGATLLSAGALTAFMLELDEAGLDLHLHTVGDRATRVALDAFEEAKAQKKGALRLRLTLSHLEFIDPSDLGRFKELGVVANFTPHWLGGYFQGAEPGLGEHRWNNRERARTVLEEGAVVTFSSDVTGYTEMHRAAPFYGMQIGHNRQEIGAEEGPIRPPEDERLSLESLLYGYTIDGAYQLRLDAVTGSIEVGKHADIAILSEDPFAADRADIHRIHPTAVLRSGRLTHGELNP